MEPIRVPAPPKEAFNKHRRVSDLIRKQVNHFKHLEQKLPENQRNALPQHNVVTEDQAARYIAEMTGLLLSNALPKNRRSPAPIVPHESGSKREPTGLAIAAAAETIPPRSKTKLAKKPAKKPGKNSAARRDGRKTS